VITEAQRERRRQGIGGSDAAAIMGWHPTRSAVDVWRDKVFPEDADDLSGVERVQWGNKLESVILEESSVRLDMPINTPLDTLVHPIHGWMLANVDGWTDAVAGGAVVEIKTLDRFMAKLLDDETRCVDGILREHWAQVQHYCEVTNAAEWIACYLVGGNDLRIFRGQRDPEIGALLVETEGAFWREHVETKIPPAGGSGESRLRVARLLYPREEQGMLTATPAVRDLSVSIGMLRAEKKKLEATLKQKEAALCELIADAEGFDLGDGKKVTWKRQEKKSYTVKASASRVLRVPSVDAEESANEQ
jgi:putative phage-type endonuclease